MRVSVNGIELTRSSDTERKQFRVYLGAEGDRKCRELTVQECRGDCCCGECIEYSETLERPTRPGSHEQIDNRQQDATEIQFSLKIKKYFGTAHGPVIVSKGSKYSQ